MVGEIIAGAATGVAQAVGPAMIEGSMVATRTAMAATEVAAPVTSAVTQGIQSGIEATAEVAQASNVGVTAMSQVASSVQHVSEGIGAIQEEVGTSLVAESMAESLLGAPSADAVELAGQLEGLLYEGADAESLMAGLGEGLVTGQEFVPTQMLIEEAQKMTDFSPEKVGDIFSAVDMNDIPQEMIGDAIFRQDVAQNLFAEAAARKEQMTEKKDISEMMGRSVESAKKNHAQRQESKGPKEEDEKDLEKLKRKAALEAVRHQMEQWRQSIRIDKRLSDDARGIALAKVDIVEKRLLLQTQMQWDGKSLLKMIAVAALYLSE